MERRANLVGQKDVERTPLCNATLVGHFETVRFLVDQGAKCGTSGREWMDSYRPCCRSHLEIARVLLKRGAIIVQQDHEGRTPVDFALVLDVGGHDIAYLLV